jgi:hypothetical protein
MAKRKPAPKALAADDFEPDAIMLRTTDKDGKDYSGFQWPMQVGAVVVCPDWNNKAECGGGLHFSPTPRHTRDFNGAAARYVACPVALADMRAPAENDEYPQKIKASRICAPCFEVDIDGEPVVTERPFAKVPVS